VETGAISTAAPASQSSGSRELPDYARKVCNWRAFAVSESLWVAHWAPKETIFPKVSSRQSGYSRFEEISNGDWVRSALPIGLVTLFRLFSGYQRGGFGNVNP
jgi:hypothetical protein